MIGRELKHKWFISRLQAMSLPEIVYRFNKKMRIQRERKKATQSSTILINRLPELDTNLTGEFYTDFSKDVRGYYTSIFPDAKSNLETILASIREGYFNILGLKEIELGNPPNWSWCQGLNQSWPKIHWSEIEYRQAEKYGDVRLSWEVNRHHHLVLMAKAFYLTGERYWLNDLKEHFYDWEKENPVGIGINWASAMELAIRVQSWTWCYFFLKGSVSYDEAFLKDLITAINQHCSWIENNLALFSSANNHLIVECVSLCITSVMFPFLPKAKNWRNLSLQHLKRECVRQVHPDGVNTEQSVHYQAFVMEALFLLCFAAERNNFTLPDEIYISLKRMCNFIAAIIDSQGNVPAIGDSDEGHIVNLIGKDFNEYQSLLNLGAVLFKSSDFKSKGYPLDEQAFWIMGPQGVKVYNNLESKNSMITSKVFPDGGYSVLRAGRDQQDILLVMDHGPLGLGSLAAHGHADSLSVTLHIDGIPVLIDPGTYIYNIEQEWRDYFRSTRSHNTVTVNEQNQSQILGPFLWGKRANAKLLFSDIQGEVEIVSAQHDGYKPIEHRRTVLFFKPCVFVLVDDIKADNFIKFEVNYHINPKLDFSSGTNFVDIRLLNQTIVQIKGLSNCDLKAETVDTWYSGRFASKVPSKAFRLSGNNSGSFNRIFTIISKNDVGLQTTLDGGSLILILDDKSFKIAPLINKSGSRCGDFYEQL